MRIPPRYRTINGQKGIPLHWADEVTGELPAAVKAYLDHRIDGTSINQGQFELVRDFMEYYINAPCWNHMNVSQDMADELAALRRDVLIIETPDHMGTWLGRCIDVGIDPL